MSAPKELLLATWTSCQKLPESRTFSLSLVPNPADSLVRGRRKAGGWEKDTNGRSGGGLFLCPHPGPTHGDSRGSSEAVAAAPQASSAGRVQPGVGPGEGPPWRVSPQFDVDVARVQNWGQSGRWRNICLSDSTSSMKLVSSGLEPRLRSLCWRRGKDPREEGAPARAPATGSAPSRRLRACRGRAWGPCSRGCRRRPLRKPVGRGGAALRLPPRRADHEPVRPSPRLTAPRFAPCPAAPTAGAGRPSSRCSYRDVTKTNLGLPGLAAPEAFLPPEKRVTSQAPRARTSRRENQPAA